MAKAKAGIDVGVNDKKAVEALKNISRAWGEFATGLNQSLEIAGKAYSFAAQGASFLAEQMGRAVDAANVQIDAEKGLATALRIRGELTEATLKGLKNQASEMQRLTRTGDETTLSIQKQLLAMDVQVDSMGDAVKATLGLAEVTGSLESATKLVARAFQGDTTALKRYGISVETTAEAKARLLDLFVLAQESADTYSGRVQQLENSWGDLYETFGRSIVESERVNRILEIATDYVVELDKAVQDSGLGESVDRLVQGLIDLGGPALEGLQAILLSMDKMAKDWDKLVFVWDAMGLAFESFGRFMLPGLHDFTGMVDTIIGAGSSMSSEDTVFGKWAESLERARRELSGLNDELSRSQSDFGLDPLKDDSAFRGDASRMARRIMAGKLDGGKKKGGKKGAASVSDSELDEALRAAGILDVVTFVDGARAERERIKTHNEWKQQTQRDADALMRGYIDDRYEYQKNLDEKQLAEEQARAKQREDNLKKQAADAEEMARTVNEVAGAQLGSLQASFGEMGAVVGQAFTDIVAGNEKNSKSIKEQFGDVIVGLGQTLVQMGIAASAMGLLGTLVPALAAVTGGPAGLAAGAITTAAGFGMIAVGAALGGGKRESGAASAGGARTAGGSGGAGSRFQPASGATNQPNTGVPNLGGQAIALTVNFNRPVTNERRTARELADLMKSRLDLLPAGVGGFGG